MFLGEGQWALARAGASLHRVNRRMARGHGLGKGHGEAIDRRLFGRPDRKRRALQG